MKRFLTSAILGCSLIATTSQAAKVVSASYDADTSSVSVEISYAKGFQKHDPKLKLEQCFWSKPIKCELSIVDPGAGDAGEMLFFQTISASLEDLNLTDPRFSGAWLTIRGDEKTLAHVVLPTW
jgi:hypothetical protein